MQHLVCVQHRTRPAYGGTREQSYAMWWRYGYSSLHSLYADHFTGLGLPEESTLVLSKGQRASGGLGDTFIYPLTEAWTQALSSISQWTIAENVFQINAASAEALLNIHIRRAISTNDEYLAACVMCGLTRMVSKYVHIKMYGSAYPLPGPGRLPIRFPVPGTAGKEWDESFFGTKTLLAYGLARHDAGVLMLPECYETLRFVLEKDEELYIDLLNVPDFR